MKLSRQLLEELFAAVGAHLEFSGREVAIVVVGRQWKTGLPPRFEEDIDWREFRYLTVGFVGRPGQICQKLFAAVDQGPRSVHWQDLIALRPTADEIASATAWVRDQDAGTEFQEFVTDAVNRLQLDLARD